MTGLQIALTVAGVCLGVALVVCLIWLGNNHITCSRHTVALKGLGKEVRIAQISDLHGKSFGPGNKKLIKKVALAAPDFIAVTGDIIHCYNDKNIAVALGTVAALSEIAPVLYVSGNHEMRGMNYREFRRRLEESGAVVLDNRSVEICGVTVTGLNGACNKNDTAWRIAPHNPCGILLAHMPHHFDNYSRAGYPLTLSGHAHGGQWRIPFFKIGIYAPGQGIFPKYTAGMYTENGCKMIVSRGLGNSRFPLRLFNPPEIVIIDLKGE